MCCPRSKFVAGAPTAQANRWSYSERCVAVSSAAVRAETENGLFKLSVAKWREPIPEAALEKLFEPFFRGEVRATRQTLGLG